MSTSTNCWQRALLPRGILLHKQGSGENELAWSLGDIGERCLLTWSATRQNDESETLLFANPSEDLDAVSIELVFRIEEWRVWPMRWSSPLGTVIRTRKLGALKLGIAALSTGKDVPALVYAAQNAF